MNQNTKEAIEQLAKAIGVMPHITHKENGDDVYCLVSDALAKLKKAEQPPALDFTKEFRRHLERERKSMGLRAKEACAIIDRLEASREDYERRLKAHSAGKAVKHICRDCLKNFWNVDDEPIICPHCGSKNMPIVLMQNE